MVLFEFITNFPSSLLFDIGLMIIIVTLVAIIARTFRQPLVPAYVITGILIGPLVLGLIKDSADIRALSEIGIAFLLFLVGLEIDIKKLKDIGPVAVLGGLLQVLITYLLAFYASIKLGFSQIDAIYLGLALAFSSTLIVIKVLSDREELDTLHGRIVLGILLLQDLVVIIALGFLDKIGTNISINAILQPILQVLVLVFIAVLFNKLIFNWLFDFVARSKELLFLTAVSVAFTFALFAYSLGTSITIGAFFAGVALASLPYHIDIIGRVSPLKDFFSIIFFVSLGMQFVLINFLSLWKPILVLLTIILLAKPFIIFLITLLFGYDKRISFLSGISLAQISEFSLILIAAGYTMGHVSKEVLSLVIFLAIVTITLTSYLIDFENKIYLLLSKFLSLFERFQFNKLKLHYLERSHKKSIILIGCHRMGGIFLDTIKRLDKNFLVIDNNPDIIKSLIKDKISCMYGDIMNEEILDNIDFSNVKFLISTSHEEEANLFLIKRVKKIKPRAKIFVTASHLPEAFRLYKAGADYVILPQILSGERIATLLRRIVKKEKNLREIRNKHIKYLEKMFYE